MGYTPPQLEVRKASGGYNIYPPNSTTTDDLFIYPNTTDTYARVELRGTTGVVLKGTYLAAQDQNGTEYLIVSYVTPDAIIDTLANKNLFLRPGGTGVVKFGAYTAGAATDSTGYITILDAAGNTRKLMVQA